MPPRPVEKEHCAGERITAAGVAVGNGDGGCHDVEVSELEDWDIESEHAAT